MAKQRVQCSYYCPLHGQIIYLGSLVYFITSQLILVISITIIAAAAAVPDSSALSFPNKPLEVKPAVFLTNNNNNNNRKIRWERIKRDKFDEEYYEEEDDKSQNSNSKEKNRSRPSIEQQYWEKIKEQTHNSERSYNEIVKELRKDSILLRDQDGNGNEISNNNYDDRNSFNDYGNYYNEREKKKPKPESNFWTFLIGGAIIIIITLIAIIITLAVHRSRTSPSATQQQSYQVTLEAPKVLVEENLYTAPPKKEPNSTATTETAGIAADNIDSTDVQESLLPLGNPNPERQPMAPFTYSPIPIRPEAND